MQRVAKISGWLLIVGAVAYCSTFEAISICSRCGRQRLLVEYQLPFSQLTYWCSQSHHDTRLSVVAQSLGVPATHSHDWKFIHGGGNGIICAIGIGGSVDRNARSPQVTAFISDTFRHRGTAEARRWLDTALDEEQSQSLRVWLLARNFPESGCDSAATYDAWRKRADAEWLEILGDAKTGAL